MPFAKLARRVVLVALHVSLAAAVPRTAAAQTHEPVLSGRVTDQTGQALPGVSVQATSVDRRSTQMVVTDQAGRYVFQTLPAGPYGLTFSVMNFAEVRRKDVVLGPGAAARLDVSLTLAVNAAVVVTGRDSFRNLADFEHPEENLVGVATAASEGAVTARQIESRPTMRAGEVLEAVPGVIISQHSGEGKANQYYLRGFNLDHGTDFATTVAGLPVNLPTHAHGQGYSDLNFLIPELVTGVQFRKGPYDVRAGDFAAAGSANINYANELPHPLAALSAGQEGWARALVAASPRLGAGVVLAAIELNHNDGPWVRPDDYRKINGVLRYSRGGVQNAFSLTALAYASTWNATDQVPDRAVTGGGLSRFDAIDASDGGRTARYSAVADYQRTSAKVLTRVTAFASKYRLNLFSDFTYALEDPVHGDQFEQEDRRWITGGRLTQTRRTNLGNRLGETSVGVELRRDAIPVVALYRTEGRLRLGTTRADRVTQASVGLFAEQAMRWSSWLRTTAGLRVDGYRFDVQSDDPANGGRAGHALVSPKGGLVLGPWDETEIYLNAGAGYHSNDARGLTITRDPSTGDPASRVTPLPRAMGAEIGFRTVAIPRVQTTMALWRLALASELVFVGDAGTTEASRPSERYGLEWTNYVRLSSTLTVDADLALSHAAFSDHDPAGDAVPGAARTIASFGLTAERQAGAFGSIRLRYFGPRPLIEDDSVRSNATSLLNAQVGYHLTSRVHVALDVFNLLNTRDSDVDYFYASRLPGEPLEGIEDVHTHPALPRTARAMIRVQF